MQSWCASLVTSFAPRRRIIFDDPVDRDVEFMSTWRQIIDELNFTYLVQRAISNKEEQIKEIMASGGVENHEHYQNLVGQIQALNFLREEIKSLLDRMEQEDE